jgi:phage shock protein E
MTKLTEVDALRGPQAQTTVVDVRTPDEYAAGHVTDAVHIPLDELEGRAAEIPRDRPVVTYCNMYHPGSSRGERAAALLQALGFDASTIAGGYPAWLEQAERDKPNE